MEYALEIKNLEKKYPDFYLNHINLSIPKGSIMGFIGANGAGKSTTMKAVLQLIESDAGEIYLFGKKVENPKNDWKEEVGVVFDEINFYETLTPKKVGNILNQAYKNWDMTKYESYLNQFELPVAQEIKTFSKGMKVKLSLATAMSHHAKLLILDEPTSGLDPIVRDEILDFFLDFVQDEEHSILISSHITTDLEKIADYITFIDKGKMLLSSTKDDLIYNYGIIRCSETDFKSINKEDIIAYKKEEYQYNVLINQKEAMKVKYPHFVMDAATIEEIMLLYVKGEVIHESTDFERFI